MGCTPSVLPPQDVVGTTLHLPNSKLRFTLKQLRNLNKKLTKLTESERTEPLSEDTEIIAERLIQRIVFGAAEKDLRFKSKNVIVLHKGRMLQSRVLEYLVVLESLQDKCAVAEGPPGCARIRPSNPDAWEDFLSPSGYLRRDKVIERWVELLARAAGSDEEILGGAPGLILTPTTFQHLNDLPLEQQCYYADADDPKSRTMSQEYRVAIVEGTPWIRVRIAGGRLGSQGVEAKIALGVSFRGWPSGSDFPGRTPLGHPDALLFYKAAQTGFFAVGGAPALGIQWSERCAGWQLWAVGAKTMLGARGDGAEKVAGTMAAILRSLREQGQPPLRVVSRFMIEEILLWRLETPAARGPASDLRTWSSTHLAHHVLCILDTLLGQLVIRTGRHYLFLGCDVVKLSVWRGARLGDREWKGDAASVSSFLNKLHTEGNIFDDENDALWSSHSRLETALIGRWAQLLQEMAPAGSTRGGRLTGSGAAPYSPRQLSYLATVARNLLTSRQYIIQDSNEWFQGGLSTTITHLLDPIEDLIHLLAIILDQARDYYLKNYLPQGLFKESQLHHDKEKKKSSSKDTLKRSKLKNCYDASAAFLIDAVRRDMDAQKEDLADDLILVRTLLKWLYKAVDDDKKYLCPVLKPYLELLFNTSHENCWHLEEVNKRIEDKEFSALTCFCKLVNDKEISPAEGLVDAASKGWQWAEHMLEMLDIASDNGTVLRLVFPRSEGQSLVFDLSLPNDARERDKWNTFLASKKDRLATKLKMAEQCVEEAFTYSLENEDIGFENLVTASKSEEILTNVKVDYNANAETLSKSHTLRSNTGTIDTMDSSKYHTLRSVSSKYNTLRNSESLFGNCWSTGNTLKLKHLNSRPTILEDRNGYYEGADNSSIGEDDVESSLHCCLRDTSPLTLVLEARETLAPHREYKGIIRALINMQKYSVLQELAGWLPGRDERTGALKALQRLARGGRRASGPLTRVMTPAHKNHYTISPRRSTPENIVRASIRQYYRQRNIDAFSDDESRKKKKPLLSAADSTETDCTTMSSSKESDERLDLEVQKECLQNLYIHDLPMQDNALTEHYLNLCREAIRTSSSKSSLAVFEHNKDKAKNKKDRTRSASEGRALKDSKLKRGKPVDKGAMTQTLGRNGTPKELNLSTDSLLGSCRDARLHHAARRSVLPEDGPFGDAFKVSQIYRSGHCDYNTMTQSILEAALHPPGRDRQRRLASGSRNNI